MTEPTDEEIIALLGSRQFTTIGAVREALRRWGTPPAGAVPLTDEQWQRIADLTGGRILTQAVKDEIERVIGIKGGQHGAE